MDAAGVKKDKKEKKEKGDKKAKKEKTDKKEKKDKELRRRTEDHNANGSAASPPVSSANGSTISSQSPSAVSSTTSVNPPNGTAAPSTSTTPTSMQLPSAATPLPTPTLTTQPSPTSAQQSPQPQSSARTKPTTAASVSSSNTSSSATTSSVTANTPGVDICAGCNKTIMGDVSHAMGRRWHLYCFVCVICQTPVSEEYYEHDSKPYCRRDFNKHYGANCAGCSKPLAGKKLKALEKEWHPQCFVCRKCKKPFPHMEYYDIDQQPYCEVCYDEEEEKLLKLRG